MSGRLRGPHRGAGPGLGLGAVRPLLAPTASGPGPDRPDWSRRADNGVQPSRCSSWIPRATRQAFRIGEVAEVLHRQGAIVVLQAELCQWMAFCGPLVPLVGDLVALRHTYFDFYGDALRTILHNRPVSREVMVGTMPNYWCGTTDSEAFWNSFSVTVTADLNSTADRAQHLAELRTLCHDFARACSSAGIGVALEEARAPHRTLPGSARAAKSDWVNLLWPRDSRGLYAWVHLGDDRACHLRRPARPVDSAQASGHLPPDRPAGRQRHHKAISLGQAARRFADLGVEAGVTVRVHADLDRPDVGQQPLGTLRIGGVAGRPAGPLVPGVANAGVHVGLQQPLHDRLTQPREQAPLPGPSQTLGPSPLGEPAGHRLVAGHFPAASFPALASFPYGCRHGHGDLPAERRTASTRPRLGEGKPQTVDY